MKIIRGIELKPGSQEEVLPDFSEDFPYIASRVELDRYIGGSAPWHWHKEVELFFVEQGTVEYNSPGGKTLFPAGSGGFVNSNVLHMTRVGSKSNVTALLHLFDPVLISGSKGSRIDQKYVLPLTSASQMEIFRLSPEVPAHSHLLEMLKGSFSLDEKSYDYELHLRTILSEMWCKLLDTARPLIDSGIRSMHSDRVNDKIKAMLIFIHEHYADKITVAKIAGAAFISERECFRLFRNCLNTSPAEYILEYRMQRACYMLAGTDEPVTLICQLCGLGSSSYFGKVFRERMGCTPMEYRRKMAE